ncbi:MAG: D-arabinono-1,4-lactone oxidase [Rothia sp. (in: high G+C Gram-positive bacteria)]|nr:D-arabinono-1,4-lactone oxidase [Rothia sp. (in: high G+C Gram-positive bacteria)]
MADTPHTGSSWSTWARQHTAQPTGVLTPRSVPELQRQIQAAAAAGNRVKVVGRGRSASAIGQPSGKLLTLDHLTGLVGVDTENLTATFLAGTTVGEANRLLGYYKLAFTNLGRLDEQTLAGAISTGFHGTGLAYGSFATQVTELKLVDASGELLTCSPQQNPEIFSAARCGLGALGIIVELTFKVVPQFRLHAAERGHSYQNIVHSFEDRARGADHYEFSWFPGSDEVRTRRLTRLSMLTDGYMPPSAALSQARRYGGDQLLNNGVFSALSYAGSKLPAVQPVLNKVSNWGKGNRRYADYSARVFTIHRTVRQNNMEYAFDMSQFADVMRDVRSHLASYRSQMAYPLVVRTAAADDIWLSQAYGRETFYISARAYWRQPHAELFGRLEGIFKEHRGRPHWGQFHTQDADALAQLYPRFDDFVELREELDSAGLFLNPYLDWVLMR